MATGDRKLVYGTPADVTITLASLAPSSSLLVGRESTAVVNTSNLFLDYLLSGKIKTNTTITAGGRIEVWVVASWDGTTWPDVPFTGSDAAYTLTNANIKNAVCRLAAVMFVDASATYHFAGVSIAQLFGGNIPPKWLVFVTHNTHATNALDSTAVNHQIRIQPIYENVAA